jgi:DNA invertase Pin-like site-specific DNA recombinase
MDLHDTGIEFVSIYTRYSNEDLQRGTTDDQTRECRRASQEKGWLVDEKFIRSDEGLSGATLASRPALTGLLNDIERSGGRITGLIIDNTSRLGRNLGDVMNICALLKFLGVFIYFVAQKLDSRDPHFYQAIVQLAQGDEQFLVNLSSAVRRGHRYSVVDGMIHGGRYFGYKSELIPDPTRRGTVTRPAILGVKLTFDPAEIAAVRKVWDWALEGFSFLSIARKCEDESLPRWDPSKPWSVSLVSGILRNNLYRGRMVWGRTTRLKDPRNGKIKNKRLPEKDWVVTEIPRLAIVTDQEWERAHAIIASHKSFGKSRLGGMGRAKGSDVLLLSGKLFCGVCNQPIVVIGTAPSGDRRYGCKQHRQKIGVGCKNSLVVHSSVIEDAIISHIVDQILCPNMLELAIGKCHSYLKETSARERLAIQQKLASTDQLKVQIGRLVNERENIKAAIKAIGASADLVSEYKDIDARVNTLTQELQIPAISPREVSIEEVTGFVHDSAARLKELLLADRRAAREAIAMHLDRLVLHPDVRNGVPVYRIGSVLKLTIGTEAVDNQEAKPIAA